MQAGEWVPCGSVASTERNLNSGVASPPYEKDAVIDGEMVWLGFHKLVSDNGSCFMD